MSATNDGRGGFSLAEVVLALGILAFVLVSIIGLLNVGLNAGKSAEIDTQKAIVGRSLLSSIRTNDVATYSGETRWFNFDGGSNANGTGAFFECVVVASAPPADIPADLMAGIKIEFRYPVSAAVAQRTTNFLYGSLLKQF